ncbi:MAG TPA: hypothetical protein VEV15_11955, partial [Flavisolibacter sp.]|nr:hypothetical protein [Flavisolibacter sp.]
ACTNTDTEREQKKMTPGGIFFDYRISGEEDKGDVTCLLQFRMGGPNGVTLLLEDPAKVELDGEIIKADSARLTGAFYETIKPVNEFNGKHSIVFTDLEKQPHTEEFEFTPFRLSTELPQKLQRKPFTIRLVDLPADAATIHITLTDTSFTTNDVNEIAEVVNGEVAVTETMINKLKVGPIVLELSTENEKTVNKGANDKGRIWMRYGLRREFELVE